MPECHRLTLGVWGKLQEHFYPLTENCEIVISLCEKYAEMPRELYGARAGLVSCSSLISQLRMRWVWWCSFTGASNRSLRRAQWLLPKGVAVLYPLLTSVIVLSNDVKCSSCLHKDAAPAQTPSTRHTRSVSPRC